MFRLPTTGDWRFTALVALTFWVLAGTFSVSTGLFQVVLTDDWAGLLRIALIAFVIPAFFEELIFRGPLLSLKHHLKKQHFIVASVILLAAFVAWHPINGAFLLTDAYQLFTDPRFLAIAALLGFVAMLLTIRTQSILPAVIFHWLSVVGWKAFLGGPSFL